MRRILIIILVVLFLTIISGCNLIPGANNNDSQLQAELTITDPINGAYLSINGFCLFKGSYSNINSIKLKIGDKEYNKMDVLANGTWEIQVNLSDVGIGVKEVIAYGYRNNNPSTAIITTDPITITVHNWTEATNPDDVYQYTVINDPDYQGLPTELTDVTTDGVYAYVSGYYINSGDKLNPFVYRVDPLLGTWDKKWIGNLIDNYGGSYDPPVVIAISDSKVYVAYSAYGMNINIKILDKELNEVSYSYYSEDNMYLFSSMYYKDGYLYLTGEDYGTSAALIFKIQDTGSGFGNQAVTTYNPAQGSKGYDITVANNNNIYIAAMVENPADSPNRIVCEFDNDLAHIGNSNSDTIDGEMYGIYYSASNNKLYATGIYPDAKDWGTDYGTVFYDGMDPDNLWLSWADHTFHQSLNTGTAKDEAGYGIIYDSETNYAVIVGYQGATDSTMTGAKASICIRNGATGVKTIVFNEDGYEKSCLNRVAKISDKYFAVGFAEQSGNRQPLIMFVPDSYD